MRYGDRKDAHPGGLWAVGLISTALLHLGIIGGVVFWRTKAGAEPRAPLLSGDVVDVQAVKFGKARDLSFLPHKEAVVHDKAPKAVQKLTTDEKALPRIDEKKEKEDLEPEDPLKRVHKFTTSDTDQPEQAGTEGEGDPLGQKGGTATVGKGSPYYQHLQAAVQNAWSVPTTVKDEELAKLIAIACIKIDAGGKISEIGIMTSSKNESFDATLLDALGKVKDAWSEAPTSDVKDTVTTNGVCLKFSKTR